MSDALAQRFDRLDAQLDRLVAYLAAPAGKQKRPITQSNIEDALEQELKSIEVRHRIFPPVACDGVAWEMLLRTYHQNMLRKPISVSSLVGTVHTPHTTGLRHLRCLVDAGLLCREPDLVDGRLHWVTISDRGRSLMVRYFTELLS